MLNAHFQKKKLTQYIIGIQAVNESLKRSFFKIWSNLLDLDLTILLFIYSKTAMNISLIKCMQQLSAILSKKTKNRLPNGMPLPSALQQPAVKESESFQEGTLSSREALRNLNDMQMRLGKHDCHNNGIVWIWPAET